MDDRNNPETTSSEEREVSNPSRRQLLKLLTAGGVVAASSLIPGRWKSPVVKSGVLPAHAQVTPTYDITCRGGGTVFLGRDQVVNLSMSATVTPNPGAGVNLVVNFNTDPASSQTLPTNASGVVNFSVNVNAESMVDLEAVGTVTFENTTLYGEASCFQTFTLEFEPE